MRSRTIPKLSAIALLVGTGIIPRVVAQINLAICDPGWTWMLNAEGQTPCHVAAFLVGPCLPDPSDAAVYQLSTTVRGDYYKPPGPGSLTPNACVCNTVLYSLISACGACQDQTYVSWTQWEANCPTVYVGQYPATIPSGISAPSWAFLDVIKANDFSIAAAQAEAAKGNPDFVSNGASSAVPASHTTAGGNPTTTFPPPGSVITTPAGSGGKKTNIGAIVGGVVGGVGGILVIGALVWYLLSRRKPAVAAAPGVVPVTYQPAQGGLDHGTPDPEKFGASAIASAASTTPAHDPSVSEVAYQPQVLMQHQQPFQPVPPPSSAPMVLYDPDDPSTFPDAQGQSSPVPSQHFSANPSPPPAVPTQPVHPVQPPPPVNVGPGAGVGSYMPTVY